LITTASWSPAAPVRSFSGLIFFIVKPPALKSPFWDGVRISHIPGATAAS